MVKKKITAAQAAYWLLVITIVALPLLVYFKVNPIELFWYVNLYAYPILTGIFTVRFISMVDNFYKPEKDFPRWFYIVGYFLFGLGFALPWQYVMKGHYHIFVIYFFASVLSFDVFGVFKTNRKLRREEINRRRKIR